MSSSDISLVCHCCFVLNSCSLLTLNRYSAAGRIQLAQDLLELLPPELTSIPEPEERATEYLHYRQFFVIWDTLESVVECQSQNVPSLDRERKAAWLNKYRVSSEMFFGNKNLMFVCLGVD